MRTRCTKTLHLVRHAQSMWNVRTAGEHVGSHPEIVDIDSRLSELGQRQIASLHPGMLSPPAQIVISSPLTRALCTATALAGGAGTALPIRVNALATEWCENSCDVGRPGEEVANEFPHVAGLRELGRKQWWPLSAKEIANGGREAQDSVDRRSTLLMKQLQAMPEETIAIVSHCMFLERLQAHTYITGSGEQYSNEYLGNAAVRTVRMVWSLDDAEWQR